jgi:hypothetical protein
VKTKYFRLEINFPITVQGLSSGIMTALFGHLQKKIVNDIQRSYDQRNWCGITISLLNWILLRYVMPGLCMLKTEATASNKSCASSGGERNRKKNSAFKEFSSYLE